MVTPVHVDVKRAGPSRASGAGRRAPNLPTRAGFVKTWVRRAPILMPWSTG